MPNIAVFHPQIVHFVIALFFVGLVLRLISLSGRLSWTNPAAATLIILAALGSVTAAKSGDQAHGPAERVPGARDAVVEHEEAGERARNLLLVVGGLELLGVVLRRQEKLIRAGSAVAGLVAGFFLYEAAEHGGEVVYTYAGGVGTRSGDTTDVRRLLLAGLYHQSRADREAGRPDAAARLTDEMVRRVPGDPTVTFLAIESRIHDRKDPQGALADLTGMTIPPDDIRLATRHGLLAAEALEAAGMRDSARAVLSSLATRFPEHQGVRQALVRLQ
ncbi:MAG TPA: DUF2231 domain-containing protein [Gemmatimonadales bacterium]